ncbi:MAG TPA: GNAT family protein [Chloroflexota bacterium]|nr:GNAT family protein [Chloroflexota bacterium]
MLGPSLHGDVVTLQPLQPDNLPVLRQWWANNQLIGSLITAPPIPTPKQEEQWYEEVARSADEVIWGIHASDAFVGWTRLYDIDWLNRHAGSQIVIAPAGEWGKGYGSEAVKLRSAHAFQSLGLAHLAAMTLAGQAGAQRILVKAGYAKIGTRQHYAFRNGSLHDVDLFQLLREEWQARRRAASQAAQPSQTRPPAGDTPSPAPAATSD